MYGCYTPSLEFARGLTPDDVAGVCAIYPPSEDDGRACDFSPLRGFSAACPAEQDRGAACQFALGGRRDGSGVRALLVVWLLAALWRARRAPLAACGQSHVGQTGMLAKGKDGGVRRVSTLRSAERRLPQAFRGGTIRWILASTRALPPWLGCWG